MTEKRFKYYEEPNGEFPFPYIKNTDGKSIISLYECCDLLNELNNENKQLKKDNKEYIRGLDLAKATSQSWASDVRELREQNCQLEKENEQLKKENLELKLIIEQDEFAKEEGYK